LKEKRTYREALVEFGVSGSIKIFEVTVGGNGWHLHVHELYFHDKNDINIKKGWIDGYLGFSDSLLPIWQEVAVKSGFNRPSDKHGLQVQNGDFAAEYIAKWGTEPASNWRVQDEISKTHIKTSKKGLSPFDLLRQFDKTGDSIYSDLFKEYSKSMKHQRQQIWSRGLKARFGIEIKTDEHIAEEQEETAVILGRLTTKQWRFIIKNKCRGVVLSLARNSGFEAVEQFLKSHKA